MAYLTRLELEPASLIRQDRGIEANERIETMELCCYNLKAIGLTCHHEQQSGPDTFTAEEIRRYISGN